MDIQAVLSALADGEFHSGEELGDRLGVSRAAVWKQLQQLEAYGLSVESLRGKGYRLIGGLDLLACSDVENALRKCGGVSPFQLNILSETDSTNAELMRRLDEGLPSGVVCAAEWQSAGRGRRGKAWASPYGSNLYFSVLWRFHGGAAALEGLSLAVGLAVAEAAESIGVGGLGLKWPNDIYVNGKKLGGILLEMQGDAAGECQVVIGIGINVSMPQAAASEIDQPWTDLSQELQDLPSRAVLLATFLASLRRVLAVFQAGGFEGVRPQWQRYDICRDELVRIQSHDQQMVGLCRGVNAQGGLLLELDGQVKAIYGGEVSLRKLASES